MDDLKVGTLTRLLATLPLAPLAHGSCATISVNCDRFWLGTLSIEVGAKLTYTPNQSQHFLPGSAVLMFCFSEGSAGISDHLLPFRRLLTVLASVSKMKSWLKSGKASIGSEIRACFSVTKASPHSWVQFHLLPFSVSRYSGLAL